MWPEDAAGDWPADHGRGISCLPALPGTGGSYWTTFLSGDWWCWDSAWRSAVAPLVTTVMSAVEPRRAGIASGINNAVSRTGGFAGLAVMGVLVLAVFDRELDRRLAARGTGRCRGAAGGAANQAGSPAATIPATATPEEAQRAGRGGRRVVRRRFSVGDGGLAAGLAAGSATGRGFHDRCGAPTRDACRRKIGPCLRQSTSSRLIARGWRIGSATMRERSRQLFDLLTPDAYYSRPIRLRHPIVFYEGHLSAFSFNTLVKRALGAPGIDAGLERLFARGIDPEQAAESSEGPRWPGRDEVRAFADEADRRVLDALLNAPIEQPGHPLLDRGQAVHAILEHEALHQETLLYMWHQLPYTQKRAPEGVRVDTNGAPPPAEIVEIPAGRATIGARRGEIAFGWDNEFEAVDEAVPAFAIDRYDVTNEAFLEFVEAGGYRDSRWWTPDAFSGSAPRGSSTRGSGSAMTVDGGGAGCSGMLPLPASWPVYVSHSEASAYARWTRPAFADRGGVRSCRIWHTGRKRTRVSVGRCSSPMRPTVISTSRVGTRIRSVSIPQAEAPGASTTSWATGGNGRRRSSARCLASGRCRRIPNTPPISSTASTM